MSIFNDDDDSFFSPVSFNNANGITSSWAYESSVQSSSSFLETSNKSSDSFNAFAPISSSATTESKSGGNFYSSSDNKESSGSGWGTAGYNSHSKDQDVSILKQQSEDSSRFGHWTPQNSYLEADNAISNLEDKDWGTRFGSSGWAYRKEKEGSGSNWVFESSKEALKSSWAFESSKEQSNWTYSSSGSSSFFESNDWAYGQQKLERWGYNSTTKEAAGDDFDFFKSKE